MSIGDRDYRHVAGWLAHDFGFDSIDGPTCYLAWHGSEADTGPRVVA